MNISTRYTVHKYIKHPWWHLFMLKCKFKVLCNFTSYKEVRFYTCTECLETYFIKLGYDGRIQHISIVNDPEWT